MVLIIQEMAICHRYNFFLGEIDKDCDTLVVLCNRDHISKKKPSSKYKYLVGFLTELLGTRTVAQTAMVALERATASVGRNNTNTQRLLFSPMNPINDKPSAREVCIVSKETNQEECYKEDGSTAIVDQVLRIGSKTKKLNSNNSSGFNFFMVVDNCRLDTIQCAMSEMTGQQNITIRILTSPNKSYSQNMLQINSLNHVFRGRIKNVIFC